MAFPAPSVSTNQQQYPIFPATTTATPDMPLTMFDPADTTAYPEFGVIGDMLDTPAQFDWVSHFVSRMVISLANPEILALVR